MERHVFENPTHEEYGQLSLVFLIIMIIALCSLPIFLLADGLVWSVLIWAVAVTATILSYRSSDARRLKSVSVEDSGIELQFKDGKRRRVDWGSIREIRALEPFSGKWLLIAAVLPFAYTNWYNDKERESLLVLRDGGRYRISLEIAEALHSGHYESTGRWLA